MTIYEWQYISALPVNNSWFSTDPYALEPVTGEFVIAPNGGFGAIRSSDGLATWRTGTRPGTGSDSRDLNASHDGSDGYFVTSDHSDNKVYISSHLDDGFFLTYTGTTGDDYYTSVNTEVFGSFAAGYLATPAAYGVKNRSGGAVVLNTGAVLPLRLKFNGTALALFCRNTATYYTTTNGTAWTTRTFPATVPNEQARNHFIVAGTKFVAVLRDVASLFISSDNGVSWTTKTLPASNYQPRVASDGANKYLVCGASASWYYSEDGGDTWTTLTAPTGADAGNTHMPIWDGAAFKVVTFMGAGLSYVKHVYQLADATPPETVWSNVTGCNVL